MDKMHSNVWLSSIVLCFLISGYYAQMHYVSDDDDANVTIKPTLVNTGIKDADGYCIYLEKKQRMVTVSVPYLEKETYYGRCRGYYFKKCLNERTVTKLRNEQRIEENTERVRRCCDGWAERPGIGCLPICERSCIFGNCTEPNTCTCYEGYEPMVDRPNVCEPSCEGCAYGQCIAPNICFCNTGYNWDSENVECVPNCMGECLNGKCIEPEKCECNEGFVHHPTQSLCTPNCSEPCINGECVETNKCECDFGYQFANESQSVCEPICELSCENAKCVEPNVCLCHNGYIVANESKPHECHCGLYCVEIDDYCHCLDEEHRVSGDRIRNNISSICSESNCMNGVCLTPYDCECNEGFEKNSTDLCVAVNETCIDDPMRCNGTDVQTCSCINGICINQTCICVNGFKMSDSDNFVCEPHCTVECIHGVCINPDSCECDVGYRLGYNESQSHICHPICDPDAEDNNGCINGTCIAPDMCQCNDGFGLDLNANYTCIRLPPNKQMQQSGGHWVSNTLISTVLLVVALCAAYYVIQKRRARKHNLGGQSNDEASEPITAYWNEEM